MLSYVSQCAYGDFSGRKCLRDDHLDPVTLSRIHTSMASGLSVNNLLLFILWAVCWVGSWMGNRFKKPWSKLLVIRGGWWWKVLLNLVNRLIALTSLYINCFDWFVLLLNQSSCWCWEGNIVVTKLAQRLLSQGSCPDWLKGLLCSWSSNLCCLFHWFLMCYAHGGTSPNFRGYWAVQRSQEIMFALTCKTNCEIPAQCTHLVHNYIQ